MVRNTKILKHAAQEGKEVLNKVYFRLLCARVQAGAQSACTCGMILWLYTVNLFWCEV